MCCNLIGVSTSAPQYCHPSESRTEEQTQLAVATSKRLASISVVSKRELLLSVGLKDASPCFVVASGNCRHGKSLPFDDLTFDCQYASIRSFEEFPPCDDDALHRKLHSKPHHSQATTALLLGSFCGNLVPEYDADETLRVFSFAELRCHSWQPACL